MAESRCLRPSVAWELLFLKGIFLFFLKLEDFWSYMTEKQLAGLDCFTSALLPAARYNPKTISLSTAFPLGCFGLYAKETQVSQFLFSALD